MRDIHRVVLDTNVLVSAALRPGSVPDQAVRLALLSCEVCASLETIAELDLVLNRAKFDRLLDRELRRDFFALIVQNARLTAIRSSGKGAFEKHELSACRDPEDHKFLALALACEADAIVSGDTDLLLLHPWLGISILTPAKFLDR